MRIISCKVMMAKGVDFSLRRFFFRGQVHASVSVAGVLGRREGVVRGT